MEPGAVGAKQNLGWPGPLQRLLKKVEAPDAGGVGVEIRIAGERVDEGLLRLPVVGEAAEMRDDEVDIGIFPAKQVGNGNFTHRVVQDGQMKKTRRVANRAIDAGVVTVHLDTEEPVTPYRAADQIKHAMAIAFGVYEGKAIELFRPAGYDAGDLPIRDCVVGMEGSEQHALANADLSRAHQVPIEGSAGVPGTGKTVAFTCVTMAVDDHLMFALAEWPPGPQAAGLTWLSAPLPC